MFYQAEAANKRSEEKGIRHDTEPVDRNPASDCCEM